MKGIPRFTWGPVLSGARATSIHTEQTCNLEGECSMAGKRQKASGVLINRAPVLTLWATVVAEVLGFDHDEALTLGRTVAGLNAYSKGLSLGLFQPTSKAIKEQRRKLRKEEIVTVDLLHRAVPVKYTDEGLRAMSGDKPIHPESVETYLEGKFGDALDQVTEAMVDLARSLPPSELNKKAYGLYEKFRPEIPPGKKGWGASGKLDLDRIRNMARSKE
jgi:hypothetical protein